MKKLKLLTITIFMLHTTYIFSGAPQLTVGFVIDQFAHHYLEKVEPHLTGGIKRLLDNGVVYNNAYLPHAYPSTGVGHATMSTGAYPSSHGIIANSWIEIKDGKYKKTNHEKIGAGPEQAVFSPDGLYDKGKGPQNIMVDNIMDQFVLRSRPNQIYKAFALSHKSRAAIGLANKLGKAIWFDQKGRKFTSSKAYFSERPSWVTEFNKKYFVEEVPKNLTWNLFHPKNPQAYNLFESTNYTFSQHPFSLIGKPVRDLIKNTKGAYDEIYIKTPNANQHLLDLAKTCLDTNFTPSTENDKFFLWISLSPLDPVGHYYGPNSQETLDMIYHLDWQIGQFMKSVEKKLDAKKILYFLTADHGVMPIPEILQKKGYKGAIRIDLNTIVKKLNAEIEKKHGIEKLIVIFNAPQFVVDKKMWKEFSKDKKKQISKTVKSFLEKQPGIAKIWTHKELDKSVFAPNDINWRFKNQLYRGRSGKFICKLHPYCAITKHAGGAHHKTPYEYDTHIPLAIYQKNSLEKKKIDKKVLMTQLANSLAKILKIAKPSASTAEPLPGI